MNAAILLALVAVITAGQVTSLAISVRTSRRLAMSAIHAAIAKTPQEYGMLEKLSQPKAGKRNKPAPAPQVFGL